MPAPSSATYSAAALVAAHTSFKTLIDAGSGAGRSRFGTPRTFCWRKSARRSVRHGQRNDRAADVQHCRAGHISRRQRHGTPMANSATRTGWCT